LTGLANRRAFDDEISRRFAEWERRKTTFSLLMLDVDHFKKFNDTHGHQAGDQVLRDVAAALSQVTREMDLVARYGGEEFAVILPVTPLADALRAAERARAAIEASITRVAGADLRVTTSIGVGQISAGDTAEGLVQRADAALYAAKKAGRNRAWYHDTTQCLPAETITAPAPAKPVAEVPVAAPAPARPAAAEAPAAVTNDARTITAFCADLRRRVLECQNFNVPLSLLLLDIDDFKSITDGLGASVRELVIETIGEFLAGSVQEMDVVSRYGEGRFAIMLPGTDLAGASQLGERTRMALAACGMQIGGSEVHFTLSLGLAQAGAADDANSLIKRADAALFASKAAGGNCAHLHNGKTYEPVQTPRHGELAQC
jgi:diguanylate cyclase